MIFLKEKFDHTAVLAQRHPLGPYFIEEEVLDIDKDLHDWGLVYNLNLLSSSVIAHLVL